jgi:hypothetical protein
MAVSGSLKLPPPVGIAVKDPVFNRWLLEVLAVLASAGGIDPTKIQGWNELVADTAQNTSNIAALQLTVSQLQAQPRLWSGTTVPANTLGKNTDWYYNTTGAAGARLYIKSAGTWVAQAI